MARVFLAQDEKLGRRVAVKQLHAESPAEAAERFDREAKLGASLNHPNLVSIYDIATDAESVLIVMEYVEGETLKDAIAAGPLKVPRVVSIVHDLAAALGHAHSQGVVHRDVKPANILLRTDRVTKLADLGIATAAEGTSITRSGMVLGTASYMAPEQLDGQKAGPAADIYALAAVAFEALSGRKALAGETPMEIAHRVVSEPPPDLREAWPEAPDGAAEALLHGMARRPEDRFSSAGELATALQRGLRTQSAPAAAPAPETAETVKADPPRPLPPRTEAPARPTYRRSRERPSWLPAAGALAALCLLAILAFATLGGGSGADDGSSDKASQSQQGRESAKDDKGREGGNVDAGSESGSAGSASSGGSASAGGGAAASGSGGASGGGASGGDGAALNSQGFRLMNAGRYEEAIPVLRRAVAAFPEGTKDLNYAYALYNLGKSLRLAGQPKEAVPVLEKRLQIPNQTETVRRELEAARRAAS
jgi:serine/threonine-protein kinase